MRIRPLLIALTLALFVVSPARAQQGTVRYEVTIEREVQLTPDLAHLADQFPRLLTADRVLSFDATTALTRDAPRRETSAPGNAQMVVRRPESVTWVSGGDRLEQTELLGRSFLIRDEAPRLMWRLTGETAEFLGYPCQKALATRDSVTVEAWFTLQIPAPVGPEAYGGLPGLILVLTDGPRSFVAREVRLGPLPDAALEPPTRGRAVTRQEYARIVREKMEELGAESGGVRVIRMN